MSSLRVAFRVDGDDGIGAGHVARCLPLACALRELGHQPTFLGVYAGLADRLLGDARIRRLLPNAGAPAGVSPTSCNAAVLDSYEIATADICRLASKRPIATLAEACRCPDAGVLIDYHLDRLGETATDRLLPGPAFAPIDPRFARRRRPRATVDRVLITVGGGATGLGIVEMAAAAVRTAFPDARLLLASGSSISGTDVDLLPHMSPLYDVVADVDLAVSAAGLTAYELACAGLPAVLLPIAENQRRVAHACEIAGTALAIDPDTRDAAASLHSALVELRDPVRRSALAARGPQLLDGRGAERLARALLGCWKQSSDSFEHPVTRG
jgi:UDP-2,4-diacetamido-2,4,6-trideoxy-beta-L-altropyranose hydrolase